MSSKKPFLHQKNDFFRDNYINYKVLIFSGVENIGVVHLGTKACGRLVIAYGKGGAMETIVSLDRDKLNVKK